MDRSELLLKAEDNVKNEKTTNKKRIKKADSVIESGLLTRPTDKQSIRLKKDFPRIKVKNKELERYVYTAMSFYPELKDVKITFKEMNFGLVAHPMFMATARFKILSIVTGRRHYIVLLNSKYRKRLLKEFTFESTVYLIAHEISHIIDYESKTRMDLLNFGAKYLVSKHRRLAEFETDVRVLHKGLGKHMGSYLDDLNKSKRVPKRFKKYRKSFYLRKEDVQKIMR